MLNNSRCAFSKNISLFEKLNAGEIFITSGADFSTNQSPSDAFSIAEIPDIAVFPALADGKKCVRCYQIRDDVTANNNFPNVCSRCTKAIQYFDPNLS